MGNICSHLLFICWRFSESSLYIWDSSTLQKVVGKYFLSIRRFRLFHVVSHRVRLLNFYLKDKRDSKHQAFPFMSLAFSDKSRNFFLGLSSQRVSHIYIFFAKFFILYSILGKFLFERQDWSWSSFSCLYRLQTPIPFVKDCSLPSSCIETFARNHMSTFVRHTPPILFYWSTDLLKSPHLLIAVAV